MPIDDPQKVWEEYYQKKKEQRLEEAVTLNSQLNEAGITEETVLAIDFVHFSRTQKDADDLSKQLSENYNMDVEPAEDNVWYIKGTSRPHGLTLTNEQHLAWVEFMSDVAQSYACVFSTWSLEAPSLGVTLTSESIESAS